MSKEKEAELSQKPKPITVEKEIYDNRNLETSHLFNKTRKFLKQAVFDLGKNFEMRDNTARGVYTTIQATLSKDAAEKLKNDKVIPDHFKHFAQQKIGLSVEDVAAIFKASQSNLTLAKTMMTERDDREHRLQMQQAALKGLRQAHDFDKSIER